MVRPWCQTFWIMTTVAVMVISWSYTGGGYRCSIPLALVMLAYTATNRSQSGISTMTLSKFCKGKVNNLIQVEKRSIILLTSYWIFVGVVSFWFPYLEGSNGSPHSLIFFTVVFIALYIAPTFFWLLLLPLSILWKWNRGMLHGKKSKSDVLEVFNIIWAQRFIICLISATILVMFVFDADITCVIRYTMKGRPCWPLLIPRPLHSHLPYPLQHAWVKSWHKLFLGYSPGAIQLFIQNLGRELGEVRTLLPSLIGVYVVSLLIVPSRFTLLRLTLFSCVAGVVLGGVLSGSLKIVLHRYRPNAYGDPYKWAGPGTTVVNYLAFSKLDLSFPAGHTSVTSAVATCLYVGLMKSKKDCSIAWNVCVILLLYMFPVDVLVSRVGDCYHWNSDATFGVCYSVL